MDAATAVRDPSALLSPSRPRLLIVGLGPGGWEGVPSDNRAALLDPGRAVILRTRRHPAADGLAARRPVRDCDDLYERGGTFEQVYEEIAGRVRDAAAAGPVAYAVPGSPWYGERSVALLREREKEKPEVLDAPSFLDAALRVLGAEGADPAGRGFTVWDGRDLPDPLLPHLPTVVFQVDTELVLADVLERLGRILPASAPITVLSDLGSPQEKTTSYPLAEVPSAAAGSRTTLFFDPPPSGLAGAIGVMRRLRRECPWDRRQTHDSLLPYLLEETFELAEAISRLPAGAPASAPDSAAGQPADGSYADVEEELGDVLLQVIFHANLAGEAGWFGVEEAAETLRAKLVRRHPHVFGDVRADTPGQVMANWEEMKQADRPRGSLMDGVPEGMPGLTRAVKLQTRAAQVGFDWPDARSVVGDVEEELAELAEVIDHPRAADEMGDVLFAAANLSRHLGADPELVLRRAVSRFESRFRFMEEAADLEQADAGELDRLWERAKQAERERGLPGAGAPKSSPSVIDSP